MKIYGTITFQEVIVLCLTAMLFVAQPFEETSVAFISLAVAGVWVLQKDKRLAKSIGIKQFGFIVLLIGVPGIFSLWNTLNVEDTSKFILFVPVFYFAGVTIYSLFMNEKLFGVLTTIIAITSIIWIFDALVQYFTGSDLLGNPLYKEKYLSGPFQNSHLGMLLTVTLPVTLKWLMRFGWTTQVVYVLALGFVLNATGIRTDLVTFLTAIVLFYIFYIRKSKHKILFVVCLLPILCSIVWIGTATSPNAKQKFEATMLLFCGEGDFRYRLNKATSGRVDIWEAGYNMFTEHPVTGIGAKCFGDAYETYKPNEEDIQGELMVDDGWHAHHPWISTLAEFGLIGFIGLTSAVAFLVLLTCKSRGGFNLYTYPWMFSFLLIVNPLNSMPPLFKMWWVPIVLLAIVTHLVDLHRSERMELQSVER